jgi:hypothetical protein
MEFNQSLDRPFAALMNRSSGILTILAAGLFGLFAIASIMLGEGNTMANVFFYLIIGGCGLALIAPKPAFVVFLLACGYIDLFKRLMVVSGRVAMDDLYYVLGLAPAMFSCIVVSLLLRGLMGAIPMTRKQGFLFLVACGVVLINAVLSALDPDRSIGKILQGTANGGLYGMLIFVVPMIYKGTDDILRLYKTVLWIFAPVAIYAIAQQTWGFRDFEIAYLQTGLSIEIKQLFTDRVRAFSTLNSPTALAIVCATLAVIPIALGTQRYGEEGRRLLGLPMMLIFTFAYLGGLAGSTGRSGLLMSLIFVVALICFRTKTGTVTFYVIGLTCFVSLVVSARFLLGSIDRYTMFLIGKLGGFFREETININTFSDRLFGFANVLMNPDAYTFFGHGPTAGTDPKDPLYNHDLISNSLVRFGAVPLIIMLACTTFFLMWAHHQILSIEDGRRRRVAATMLASAMAMICISSTAGNVLMVFPANVFLWLAVSGAILTTATESKKKEPDKTPTVHPASRRRSLPPTAHSLAS